MAKFATVEDYLTFLPESQRAIADKLLPLIETALPGAGAVWHGHTRAEPGPRSRQVPGLLRQGPLRLRDLRILARTGNHRPIRPPRTRRASNGQRERGSSKIAAPRRSGAHTTCPCAGAAPGPRTRSSPVGLRFSSASS